MIRMLFIFTLLLASVWMGVQLQHDPGYVLIAINKWTLETTVWVTIAALLLFFFFLHLFFSLFSWLLRTPASWRSWHAKHRVQQAQAKTRQGLIEFSEGYWQQAKNHLIKALPDADTPLLNYLTAARAAQEMGDSTLRDDYLRQAQQSMPEATIAVELTQAQLQLANKQWEQALATLRHLQTLAPRHPYVLKLLMYLYQDVKDWPQLIALLPELKRNKVVSEQEFQKLQQHAYLQAMVELIKQNQSQALRELLDTLPKTLINDPALMAEYSRYLLRNEDYAKAEALLRRCLRKQFDARLIELYGEIKNDRTQLNFAQSLLKIQPHSAALYLCLGRLSQTHGLWGQAKPYLEESIKLGATPATYIALGQLLEQTNDHAGACNAYRQGLLLAAT